LYSTKAQFKMILERLSSPMLGLSHAQRKEMKSLAMASAILLVGLGGCATPARIPAASGAEASISSEQAPTQPPPVRKRQAKPISAVSVSPASRLQSSEPVETYAEPDAVIKLDPKTGKLTREMEARLLMVAEGAKKDDRIIFRLEAYVPDGGSPALSIGVADKALHIVKDRLLAHGISARRILQASFGQEHDEARDLYRHWVEIYLVKKGGSS